MPVGKRAQIRVNFWCHSEMRDAGWEMRGLDINESAAMYPSAFLHPASWILHPASCILHPGGCILNSAASIRIPQSAFRILHSAFRIPHSASRISHLASRISHLASRISHLASRIWHLESRISHPASRIPHLASRIPPSPPPMHLTKLQLLGIQVVRRRHHARIWRRHHRRRRPQRVGQKSNIVDAILWALGERSHKALRGHAATDVIFQRRLRPQAHRSRRSLALFRQRGRRTAHRLRRKSRSRAVFSATARASIA